MLGGNDEGNGLFFLQQGPPSLLTHGALPTTGLNRIILSVQKACVEGVVVGFHQSLEIIDVRCSYRSQLVEQRLL